MKTIKTFTAAFGGHSFRVTSNGITVNYGERGPGASRFCVKATEPAETFEAWADKVGLFDPYRGDDPALVYHRMIEITTRKKEKEAAERYAREKEAGRRLFQMQKDSLARRQASSSGNSAVAKTAETKADE